MKPLLIILTLSCLFPIRADDTTSTETEFAKFQSQTKTVIIKGYSDIGSFTGKDGSKINIKSFESSAKGLKNYAIQISTDAGGTGGFSVFIDWDEISSLLAGIDSLLQVNKTSTKLDYFAASYTTRGGLRFTTRNDYPNAGKEIWINIGADNVWTVFNPEELIKIKALIQKAQATLQSIQ